MSSRISGGIQDYADAHYDRLYPRNTLERASTSESVRDSVRGRMDLTGKYLGL